MKNKYVFIILVLFLLNSCGIGLFGIGTENRIFRNDKPIQHKSNVLFENLTFGYETNVYEYKEKENVYVNENFNNIKISVNTYENSKLRVLSFGILPLIPAPPIIPTFFFPAMGHKEFCGGESYKVELVFESKNNDLDNIEIDLRNIYLLKNDKKIYASNYTNELKTYQNAVTKKTNLYKKIFIIDFPITCKETNNGLIFVENVKINNEIVSLPIGKIIYKSGWVFIMGYFVNN